MSLKKFYNILYFNIFRIHCFCQYWVAKPIFEFLKPIRRGGILSGYHENENKVDYEINDVLNNPKGGISLFLTAQFMGMMQASLVFTFWNLACALLQLDFYYWKYGAIFVGVVGVVANFAFPHEYLSDFKTFRSWSISENRKFAIIAFLVISGICLAFVSSFALYMSIAISNKT